MSLIPSTPKWLEWVIVVPLTIGAGVLAHKKKNEVKIIQGSVFGAYYLARALSMNVGGFQNEKLVYVKVTNG